MNKKVNAIFSGIIGSIILLLIYIGILTWANSYEHAIEEYKNMWYWFTTLIIGFGIQIGLFNYIHTSTKSKKATAQIAATSGVTTGSMVLCCAHHLVDILPILGLTAASIFLIKYQIPFILIGIFSNIIGILMMLNIIKKLELYSTIGLSSVIFKLNIIKLRNILVIISTIIIIFAFIKA